jgi:hypothetical protein
VIRVQDASIGFDASVHSDGQTKKDDESERDDRAFVELSDLRYPWQRWFIMAQFRDP